MFLTFLNGRNISFRFHCVVHYRCPTIQIISMPIIYTVISVMGKISIHFNNYIIYGQRYQGKHCKGIYINIIYTSQNAISVYQVIKIQWLLFFIKHLICKVFMSLFTDSLPLKFISIESHYFYSSYTTSNTFFHKPGLFPN